LCFVLAGKSFDALLPLEISALLRKSAKKRLRMGLWNCLVARRGESSNLIPERREGRGKAHIETYFTLRNIPRRKRERTLYEKRREFRGFDKKKRKSLPAQRPGGRKKRDSPDPAIFFPRVGRKELRLGDP